MISDSPNQESSVCISVHLRKCTNDQAIKLEGTKIPIVDEHYFLGVIFDKKLSLKHLKSKCNKALQLLQVVAHTE